MLFSVYPFFYALPKGVIPSFHLALKVFRESGTKWSRLSTDNLRPSFSQLCTPQHLALVSFLHGSGCSSHGVTPCTQGLSLNAHCL